MLSVESEQLQPVSCLKGIWLERYQLINNVVEGSVGCWGEVILTPKTSGAVTLQIPS